MIIRGILDSSLNGQLCIRGFAPIKELARISKADYDYQRDLLEAQEAEIRDFLDKEPYLFFPEVILSYKIKHNLSSRKSLTYTPIQRIQSGGKYKSGVDNTVIKVKKSDFKLANDVRGNSFIILVELILDDAELTAAINSDNQPFHRIDGNHRLSSAENIVSSKVDAMVAPFCIILGQEFYSRGELVEDESTNLFNKSVKVFFHNINTKSVPLTSEENKKVIIDDKTNFRDDELTEIIGLEAVKSRELIDKVNPNFFTGISHVLSAQYRTFYIDIFRYLLRSGQNENEIVEKVFLSLKAVDNLYLENDKLKQNSGYGLLAAFLYYHVTNPTRFLHFKTWVMNNHIFELTETKAESIIGIFDKISQKRSYKVFVAVPYWSHAVIQEYNKLFKEILAEVSRRASIDLELIPIMRFKGRSKRIDKRLLDAIQDCDVFIANITGSNVNVIFEVGYAEGADKPMILIKEETDTEVVPFDMDKLQWIPYPKDGYYNSIKNIIINNLSEVLRKDLQIEI
jgi:nucleoside 2-deoxyribosyltransferase